MLGPSTYEDPSRGFNSQFSCTVRGAVFGSTIANLIGPGVVRTVGSHGEI